jgi:hypothetical protein
MCNTEDYGLLYHQEGSLRNFSLTLVDTPGVGDTKGLKGIRRQ